MPSLLRSVAIVGFLSLAALGSIPGCSLQGEGERCENAKTGSADCDGGLRCIPRANLLDPSSDRCCPDEGSESDPRCTRVTQGGGTSGSSNGGSGPVGGTSAGGAPVGGDANGEPLAGNAGATSTPSAGGMSAAGAPSTTTGGVAESSGGAGGAG